MVMMTAMVMMMPSRVRCHTSHITRHTSHVTCLNITLPAPMLKGNLYAAAVSLTSHAAHHASHVTRHTSHVTRHTSRITKYMQHFTHRHTSHVTRHTSHVTCDASIRYPHILTLIPIPTLKQNKTTIRLTHQPFTLVHKSIPLARHKTPQCHTHTHMSHVTHSHVTKLHLLLNWAVRRHVVCAPAAKASVVWLVEAIVTCDV